MTPSKPSGSSESSESSVGPGSPECPHCAALEHAPVTASPHAYLLLHSEAGINLGGTGAGHVEYYVCTICNTRWERDRAWSEPHNVWKHTSKPLD